MNGWVPSSVEPDNPGWYECRHFAGDIPVRYWFDGALWRHGPDGEITWFGNDADDDNAEVWRIAPNTVK